MKLFEIKENKKYDVTELKDIKQLLDTLHSKCKKAFAALENGNILYRGDNYSGAARIIDTTNSERQARGTRDLYNIIIDQANNTGVVPGLAKRKKSLICSPSQSVANGYNASFTVLFPFDDAVISTCNESDIWNSKLTLWGYYTNVKDLNEILHNTFHMEHYSEQDGDTLKLLENEIRSFANDPNRIKILKELGFSKFDERSSIQDVYDAFLNIGLRNTSLSNLDEKTEHWVQGKMLQINLDMMKQLLKTIKLSESAYHKIFRHMPTFHTVKLLSDNIDNIDKLRETFLPLFNMTKTGCMAPVKTATYYGLRTYAIEDDTGESNKLFDICRDFLEKRINFFVLPEIQSMIFQNEMCNFGALFMNSVLSSNDFRNRVRIINIQKYDKHLASVFASDPQLSVIPLVDSSNETIKDFPLSKQVSNGYLQKNAVSLYQAPDRDNLFNSYYRSNLKDAIIPILPDLISDVLVDAVTDDIDENTRSKIALIKSYGTISTIKLIKNKMKSLSDEEGQNFLKWVKVIRTFTPASITDRDLL